MAEIWPAGPPKLRAATRIQTRSASVKETLWGAGGTAAPEKAGRFRIDAI